MRIAFSISTLLLAGIAGAAHARQITADNWMRHPEIRTIRTLYRTVESAVSARAYTPVSVSEACADASASIEATLLSDSSGLVRKYALAGGSDDAAGEASYYYDGWGTHRFSFQSLRAHNGTHLEIRTYFDASGAHLYTDRRLLAGPGYPAAFPSHLPAPRAHLASLCPDGEVDPGLVGVTKIPTLGGMHVDHAADIPTSFEHLEASASIVRGLPLENGRLRVVAVVSPIHHTGNGVLFLAFRHYASGFQFVARSNIIDVGGVLHGFTIDRPPARATDGTLMFRVAIVDGITGTAYEFDVRWDGEANTLSATHQEALDESNPKRSSRPR